MFELSYISYVNNKYCVTVLEGMLSINSLSIDLSTGSSNQSCQFVLSVRLGRQPLSLLRVLFFSLTFNNFIAHC